MDDMCFIYWPFAVCADGSSRLGPLPVNAHQQQPKMCKKKERAYWIHFRFLSSDWLYMLTVTCTYFSAPTAAATTKLFASLLFSIHKHTTRNVYKSQGNALLYIIPFGFSIAAAPWNRFHQQYFVKRMKKKKISQL
jgi:hypothetical protein